MTIINTTSQEITSVEWAVIGAGPAGIAAVGQLLERKIPGDKILWIDPHFKLGDFGCLWGNVDSNTTVSFFTDYLKHLKSFEYDGSHPHFEFDDLGLDQTCKLHYMHKPLAFITTKLREKVKSFVGSVDKINLSKKLWNLKLHDGNILCAKNVILATGATPKNMVPPENVEIIHLQDALNPEALAQHCSPTDKVAVFGASHSAVIIIRDLLALNVNKVINFYHNPLKFAVNLGDWILFDDTGLKGKAATWARENLNGTLPTNLERIYSSRENVAEYLPFCTKVIYAIGFAKRTPLIEGYPEWTYNPHNGIIAPGLFGVGIGFPESKTDPYGNTESRVGLRKFMYYLDEAIPLWLKYSV